MKAKRYLFLHLVVAGADDFSTNPASARYQNFDQVRIRDRQNGTNLTPCRIPAGVELDTKRYQKGRLA